VEIFKHVLLGLRQCLAGKSDEGRRIHLDTPQGEF